MLPLDPWQKSVLKTVRNRQRERGVLLYVLTGSGVLEDEAYRIQTNWTRSLLRTFSGAVAWTPSEQRSERLDRWLVLEQDRPHLPRDREAHPVAARQRERHLAPDAARGARHQHELALQPHGARL